MASRRLGFILLWFCWISKLTADDARIRAQVDELYSHVCRDPVRVFIKLEYLLMVNPADVEMENYEQMRRDCYRDGGKCPKLVEPYRFRDILPYQSIGLYKCHDKSSYCPTLTPSRCVSIPLTERETRVAFMLNNGTIRAITTLEDTHCACAVEEDACI